MHTKRFNTFFKIGSIDCLVQFHAYLFLRIPFSLPQLLLFIFQKYLVLPIFLKQLLSLSLSVSLSLSLSPPLHLSLFLSPLLGIKFKIYFHLKLFCLKMDCKPPEICTLYIVQHIHTNCHTYDSMYINEYLLGKTLRHFFFIFLGFPIH